MGEFSDVFKVVPKTPFYLVVSTNPFEKYAQIKMGIIFPNFPGENKKYLSCHHLAFFFKTVLCFFFSQPLWLHMLAKSFVDAASAKPWIFGFRKVML